MKCSMQAPSGLATPQPRMLAGAVLFCRDARGYDDGASVQWRGCKRPI
jgi:hypothetical protein